MKSLIHKNKRRFLAFLGLVVSLSCACTSAGDADLLQFRGNLFGSHSGDICTYQDFTRFVSSGTLDLAVRDHYDIAPLLQSLMTPINSIPNQNPNAKDTNTINLTSMTVTVVAGAWPAPSGFLTADSRLGTTGKSPPPLAWVAPISGVILAGGQLGLTGAGLVPSFGLDGTDLTSTDVYKVTGTSIAVGDTWQARFAATSKDKRPAVTVVLSVVFNGLTVSGSKVSSVPFTFPLTVCWGCLLTPHTPTADSTSVWASCSGRDPGANYTYPCSPGQDELLDCAAYCALCNQFSPSSPKKCDKTYCPVQ